MYDINRGKSRKWCGTNYDMELDWTAIWDRGDLNYLVKGNEICPDTGRAHQQWFAWFKNERSSIKSVSKMFGGCHTEKCYDKARIADNIEYCKKEHKWKEWGRIPQQGGRTDLYKIMRRIREEGMSELNIIEEAPQLWVQYGRRFEQYRALLQKDRKWITDVRVWWGPAGSGKTRAAIEWLGDYDAINYTRGGFFQGYTNCENVLLDDFDGMATMERRVFLNMTDRYKLVCNVKNGEKNFNAKKIAITSNMDPSGWYEGDSAAVLRRISGITKMEHK